jgi:glycosyltransferase involved in cell wall biosynthesis
LNDSDFESSNESPPIPSLTCNLMATVSVIITTHNRPALLPAAISSARNAARDVEIIVVDDASCDDTAAVCESTSDIKYVRVDRNQGVAGARNIGLVASRGEYITFLDDDDVRLPNSLDRQIEALEHDPNAAFVYGQAIPESSNGERGAAQPGDVLSGDIFWRLLTRNFIPCGSVVFRRSVVSKIGLLDDAIPGLDDWDFWVRIAELFPSVAIKVPVLIWRQSSPASTQGSSNTIDVIAKSARHFRRVFAKLPRFADASRIDQRRAWRNFSTNVAEHLAWETFSGFRKGAFRHALRSARTLLSLHPSAHMLVFSRWMNIGTMGPLFKSSVAPDEIAAAKLHFKTVRSNLPDNENHSLQKSF